jgi:hypothetical protein
MKALSDLNSAIKELAKSSRNIEKFTWLLIGLTGTLIGVAVLDILTRFYLGK